MRYLRNLILRLWPPPCGRHARFNLRPASLDGRHPIPRPRPPVPRRASVSSTPPPPTPVDDPTLARPYLLAAELRRTLRPAVQERHDTLTFGVTAPPETPSVDLEDLAVALRGWHELAGVGS
ncbi:hypothetical protein ACIBFB_07375 [Nocardiopsis sp. NPDC050513]|uniref:hypothetical protein n=1 Tax=Nocardiopsis sp. NPDC050513 TaxID=3364338 RepID=UPI0037A64975